MVLIDHVPGLSFFVKDRKCRFVALNQRGCEYCGVSSESEAIGRTDHDFFPKQRADEYVADDRKVMQSGEPVLNQLESAPEAEGSPRLVVTSKIPLRDEQGNITGVAGISREFKRLNRSAGLVDAFASVVEYMHQHFEAPLSTPELAAIAGTSVSQFERRFRLVLGVTPHQYLLRIRVEAASRMLIDTDKTITEIALDCGFCDHAHFSRTFSRQMNIPPSDYRKRRKNHSPT